MIGATLLLSIAELCRHRLRSLLTALGVVVGVASVVSLVTLGRGATAKVNEEISSLGSNLLIITPKAPSFGSLAGSQKPLTVEDVLTLKRDLPAVLALAPTRSVGRELVLGSETWNTTVVGTTAAYLQIRGYQLEAGDSLPDSAGSASPVCVLGSAVKRQLEKHGRSVQRLHLPGFSCEVVGTLRRKGQSGLGDDPDNVVLAPLGAVRQRLAGDAAPSPAGAPLQVYYAPSACSGPPGTSPRWQARAHSQERLERRHPRHSASAPRPHHSPHRRYPTTALSSGALFWRPLKPLQVPLRSSP